MYVAKEKGSKVVKKLVDGGQDVILPSYQAAVEVVEFLKNCGNNPLDLPWGGPQVPSSFLGESWGSS